MGDKLPYFRWFPADAETDEEYSAMDDAEVGFYHRCLNKSWINHGLPAVPAELARVLRVSPAYLRKMWERVGRKFEPSSDSGRLVNRRQEEERSKAVRKSEQATESIRTRYGRSTDVVPRTRARAGSGSDSDSSGVVETTTPEVSTADSRGIWPDEECEAYLKALDWNPKKITDEMVEKVLELDPALLPATEEDAKTLAGVHCRMFQFELFWQDYWRKVSKKDARHAWFVATDDSDRIVDIQRAQVAQTPEMLARPVERRPHASTWLNQERWKDEVVPVDDDVEERALWAN